MERGLLSSPELAAHYDDVVWMYLFQDFSHSEGDQQAERIAIRFGISSWPQHFLIDPANLEILGSTGRELETFRAAVMDARQVGKRAEPGLAELRAFDVLAAEVALEEGTTLAEGHIDHTDRVVRYQAVRKLAKVKPEVIVRAASELLAVPHDQLRYTVCEVLTERGSTKHARALDSLVRDPGERSMNPNVVRCRAATALATCGDPDSLEVLEPFATVGTPYNSLTGICLSAVTKIAGRYPEVEARARAILLNAFPPLPVPAADETEESRARVHRAVVGLAKRVHESFVQLTGEERAFPEEYDAVSRAALIAAWR